MTYLCRTQTVLGKSGCDMISQNLHITLQYTTFCSQRMLYTLDRLDLQDADT